MQIQNCITADVDKILKLYEDARTLQLSKKMVVWPSFEKEFIEREIQNKQQWKILIDGEIACNWSFTFNDQEIWEDRERGDAIYIHRIATNRNFRGNNFVEKIVEWAKIFAIENDRKYVRLDTLGNNTGLIEHYTKSGFTFLGIVQLKNTKNLPMHYQEEPNCCLFEIEI